MGAEITIKIEMNEKELYEFMVERKGYEVYTREDIERELKHLSFNELKYLAYVDESEKEIKITGEIK